MMPEGDRQNRNPWWGTLRKRLLMAWVSRARSAFKEKYKSATNGTDIPQSQAPFTASRAAYLGEKNNLNGPDEKKRLQERSRQRGILIARGRGESYRSCKDRA